ncbi:MAG: hypothetical protein ABH824_00760 [Nanoarchaeota archaeon]|nr:hypothetical protein [Nanoarchaeota archaeon]MBU1632177.1 hypothetical protein [Nanoarchaeota archaeon]MBU1875498.1 hypothetical protein [Nanoarchaeota archaeon]
MKLSKLKKEEVEEAGKLLVSYWKSRDMPEYNLNWAKDYLIKGHNKETIKDEFFTFREKGKLMGFASLITNVSKIAEIRDEITIKDDKNLYLKRILKELLKLAKLRKLRKLYSLVLPKNLGVYKSLAFKKEGILKDHFKDGEDFIIMSKMI